MSVLAIDWEAVAWGLGAVLVVLVLVRFAALIRDVWDRERAFREINRRGRR